jgi:hypothetical protein
VAAQVYGEAGVRGSGVAVQTAFNKARSFGASTFTIANVDRKR